MVTIPNQNLLSFFLSPTVVDVVRTDTHLEFYEDPRNLGRMSDILAVYAWVDPATGYCQGSKSLLSWVCNLLLIDTV